MRRVFDFGIEVRGFGDVTGQFGAEDGDVDEIILPDGEIVEVSRALGPSHPDPLVKLLAERVIESIHEYHWHQLDQTRERERRLMHV